MAVAKEFESYLLEQVMKSMQKMTSVTGDSDGESASASLFNSLVGITGEETDSAMSTLSDYYGDELISQLASTLTTSVHRTDVPVSVGELFEICHTLCCLRLHLPSRMECRNLTFSSKNFGSSSDTTIAGRVKFRSQPIQ